MNKLVIYGAAFHDLIKLIDAINRVQPTWELLGFLDDTPEKQGWSVWGYQVLGGKELLPALSKNGTFFFNNVCGHWERTKNIADLLASHHCQIASLVHPMIDLNHVKLGKGCIIPEGCVLGGDVEIGDFVTVRLNTVISHGVKVEDYVFIGPGVTIGSEAVLGEGCRIGAGATIMIKRNIGQASIVGAGAVVTKDVPAGITVAGVPARPIES